MGLIKMSASEIFMPQEVVGKILNERVQLLETPLIVKPIALPESTSFIGGGEVHQIISSSNKKSDTLFWVLTIGGTIAVATTLYLYQSGYFRAKKPIRRREYKTK